jgi:hypothetical protein
LKCIKNNVEVYGYSNFANIMNLNDDDTIIAKVSKEHLGKWKILANSNCVEIKSRKP